MLQRDDKVKSRIRISFIGWVCLRIQGNSFPFPVALNVLVHNGKVQEDTDTYSQKMKKYSIIISYVLMDRANVVDGTEGRLNSRVTFLRFSFELSLSVFYCNAKLI